MDYGLFLQILIIIAGVLILFIDIVLLAKRKLSEPVSIMWGFVAVVFVVAGIVLRPSGWINYLSMTGLILVCMLMVCVVYAFLVASCHISELMRKQTEMAMQISLLNQELVEIKRYLAEKEKEENKDNK